MFKITGSTTDLSGICIKERKLKSCPHFHMPEKKSCLKTVDEYYHPTEPEPEDLDND